MTARELEKEINQRPIENSSVLQSFDLHSLQGMYDLVFESFDVQDWPRIRCGNQEECPAKPRGVFLQVTRATMPHLGRCGTHLCCSIHMWT